eukprot:CAMPEP_0194734314 /NCGR_PEP_ID=MMETSP0296-20130528/69104_1 /TAXON_ID=39354 /ORGANISM="Heterosigma akashiwo, Strain CCMP2393" /LENGTH=71 /DNA_ID=CAMNT_0039643061 /DNA_START=150 /DNA_END=362 /DNA_ORIENTATION=+
MSHETAATTSLAALAWFSNSPRATARSAAATASWQPAACKTGMREGGPPAGRRQAAAVATTPPCARHAAAT